MMKHSWRLTAIMAVFFCLLTAGTNAVHAQSLDIVEQGKYWGVQEESLDTMKTMAKRNAWQRAIERATVWVQAFSVVKAGITDTDTVRTLAEGLIHVQEAPKYSLEKVDIGTLVTAEVHVMVEADEETLQERLQDRQKLAETRKKYKDLEENYTRIKTNLQALQSQIKESGPSATALAGIEENEQALRLNDLLQEGERELQQKKMAEAGKIFDQAVSQFPKASDAYSARARCNAFNAIMTGNVLELEATTILADANKALALNPSNTEAYHVKITYYLLQKRLDDALETVQECLSYDPQDAQAYVYRAIIYKSLKDYSKALQDFDHAVGLNPELADAPEIQDFRNKILKKLQSKT